MGLVRVERVLRTGPKLHAGASFPGVVEPAHVAQFGGQPLSVAYQGGEHPAGFDRAQLGGVTDQEHLGPGVAGGTDQFVEGERARQGGFFHDDELAAAEPPAGQLVLGRGDAPAHRQTAPLRGAGRPQRAAEGRQLGQPRGLLAVLVKPFRRVLRVDAELAGQDLGRCRRGRQPEH